MFVCIIDCLVYSMQYRAWLTQPTEVSSASGNRLMSYSNHIFSPHGFSFLSSYVDPTPTHYWRILWLQWEAGIFVFTFSSLTFLLFPRRRLNRYHAVLRQTDCILWSDVRNAKIFSASCCLPREHIRQRHFNEVLWLILWMSTAVGISMA